MAEDSAEHGGTQPAIILLAAFADMQSAIRIHGSPNGARLVLDAPEVNMDDLTKLLHLRGRTFYLAFIATDEAPGRPIDDPAPRRSQWLEPPEV